MRIFVQAGDTEVLAAGVLYLRVEGAFYVGIGCLFLLYGFYRAVKRPGMSVVLTVISLGTPGGAGLRAGGASGRGGDLDGDSHRLVPGGRHGVRILSPAPAGSAGRE